MKIVIQRSGPASVKISGKIVGKIQKGLVILLGIASNDTEEDIEWLCKKIIALRIFPDEEGKMNKSLKDIDGEILLISQFTLHASTKKGNRPSFIEAARPEIAVPLYEKFTTKLSETAHVETGQFGAEMDVALINEGPVTIIIDSKNRI